MNQTVLIIARKNDRYFLAVEEAIFDKGFQTLAVPSLSAAADRLNIERFSAIVLDAVLCLQGDENISILQKHPLGAITPLVLVGQSHQPNEVFGAQKTLMDQAFDRKSMSPENIAEYLAETVTEANVCQKHGNLQFVGVPAVMQMAHSLSLTGAISFRAWFYAHRKLLF